MDMPNKKRILLAEDEEHLLEAIKLNLELEGYKVSTANNGKKALQKFKEERFNLVILDVMMPEVDGFVVAETIRLENSEVPIMFLTAKNTNEDKIAGLKKGADDYLTKPVANADLVRAIEARLRRSEQQMRREFRPDFCSMEPLQKLGLTPRVTDTLLWLAQGKTNADIATILGISESTVKKYVQEIFEKLGIETRGAATVRALELLNAPVPSDN